MSINYYQLVPSKMKKTQVISKNSNVNPYIPETKYLTKKNFTYMLNQYSKVVFKPDIGGGGENVGSITRENDKYTIHYLTHYYRSMSINRTKKFFRRMLPRKTFLIQKGIDLIKYNENPVDIRVLMQKPYKNWKITGVIAKMAAKNKMVTNIHSGGTGIPFAEVMKNTDYCQKAIEDLKEVMCDLAYSSADTLNETYPGIKELGFDFGVDNDLYPWILEVNTGPQYKSFKGLKDKSIFKEIDKNHKIILNSIKYYSKKKKRYRHRYLITNY